MLVRSSTQTTECKKNPKHIHVYVFNESLSIQNTVIPKTDSIDFPGVSVDTKLHWVDHIQNLKSQLSH